MRRFCPWQYDFWRAGGKRGRFYPWRRVCGRCGGRTGGETGYLRPWRVACGALWRVERELVFRQTCPENNFRSSRAGSRLAALFLPAEDLPLVVGILAYQGQNGVSPPLATGVLACRGQSGAFLPLLSSFKAGWQRYYRPKRARISASFTRSIRRTCWSPALYS